MYTHTYTHTHIITHIYIDCSERPSLRRSGPLCSFGREGSEMPRFIRIFVRGTLFRGPLIISLYAII